MYFTHDPAVRERFGALAAGVLAVDGIHPDVDVTGRLGPFHDRARARLDGATESDLPEIQAWRRAYSAMGLKPTQYRAASEALLRRFRKEDGLPSIHPVVDVCNAVSLAYAIPVAVFDTARVTGGIRVRPADGTEVYRAFSGDEEHPAEGEIVFADEDGVAHARRWVNRQSAASAARPDTASVLVVAEALHETAAADVARLVEDLAAEFTAVWGAAPATAQLTAQAPRFEFAAV